MTESQSRLLGLPQEIRFQILLDLITPGLCIETAILRTCRLLHVEGTNILYTRPFQGPVSRILARIPPPTLRRLRNLTLVASYTTNNRGECAVELTHDSESELGLQLEAIALTLLEPETKVERLHVELQPTAVRKAGGKAFKGETLLAQMQLVLVPFAYLRKGVKVTMGGFESISFVDGFMKMRACLAGSELPWEGRCRSQGLQWWKGVQKAESTVVNNGIH